MAFDRNNATHLALLKSEVNNDPQSVGYMPTGNTPSLLKLLNLSSNNPTNATHTRDVDELFVSDFSISVVASEYDALDAFNKEWVKSILIQSPDTSLGTYKEKFLLVFNSTTTLTNIQARRDVSVSRAEELFGYGTVLKAEDWFAARDS